MNAGSTLYLKNMVDKEGKSFQCLCPYGQGGKPPTLYKWNPDKKQDKGKVEAVAEENKTQVAVNNHGKTNEATKHVNEWLKTSQIHATVAQLQEQYENKQKKSRRHKM